MEVPAQCSRARSFTFAVFFSLPVQPIFSVIPDTNTSWIVWVSSREAHPCMFRTVPHHHWSMTTYTSSTEARRLWRVRSARHRSQRDKAPQSIRMRMLRGTAVMRTCLDGVHGGCFRRGEWSRDYMSTPEYWCRGGVSTGDGSDGDTVNSI